MGGHLKDKTVNLIMNTMIRLSGRCRIGIQGFVTYQEGTYFRV